MGVPTISVPEMFKPTLDRIGSLSDEQVQVLHELLNSSNAHVNADAMIESVVIAAKGSLPDLPAILRALINLRNAILQDTAPRVEWPSRKDRELAFTQYNTELRESFENAAAQHQTVSVDANVMAGAPCIRGTRIPIYMVLDAIEHSGEVQAALRSYPRLTVQQIKDAIGFAELVVECPIDNETSPAAR